MLVLWPGFNINAMFADPSLYLDLSPVTIDGGQTESDGTRQWMESHLMERLMGGSTTPGAPSKFGDPEGESDTRAALARRGSETEGDDRSDELLVEFRVGCVPPPSKLCCWHCGGVCLPDRPPVPIVIGRVERKGTPYFVADGVACRFPCAAAVLYTRAGRGAGCFARDTYMLYMSYLRLLYQTYTGIRYVGDFERSPDPTRVLREYGLGSGDAGEYARQIAALDPYERWRSASAPNLQDLMRGVRTIARGGAAARPT